MSSGLLLHVALVRTDVSEELSTSFIRVTRIGEIGTTLAVKQHTHAAVATEAGEASADLRYGCCVANATDSSGRQSRFSRAEPLFFSPSNSSFVRLEVSTAVTMKNGVF
jgi:hypothetical protein